MLGAGLKSAVSECSGLDHCCLRSVREEQGAVDGVSAGGCN